MASPPPPTTLSRHDKSRHNIPRQTKPQQQLDHAQINNQFRKRKQEIQQTNPKPKRLAIEVSIPEGFIDANNKGEYSQEQPKTHQDDERSSRPQPFKKGTSTKTKNKQNPIHDGTTTKASELTYPNSQRTKSPAAPMTAPLTPHSSSVQRLLSWSQITNPLIMISPSWFSFTSQM